MNKIKCFNKKKTIQYPIRNIILNMNGEIEYIELLIIEDYEDFYELPENMILVVC